MIDNDSQMQMIVANINDKMLSITHEVKSREKSYAYYIDEKLQSIEWDIKVLRSRVNNALEEQKEEK